MSGAIGRTPLERGISSLYRVWSRIRHFLRGARVAGIPTASLVIGVLLFTSVPQAQDLFLEIRGNRFWGVGYWVVFYLLVLLAWALPVYVSARWILRKSVEGVSDYPETFPVKRWVARLIPPLYATLCFVAVMVGQWIALDNAPTIYRWCAAFDQNDWVSFFASGMCGERLYDITVGLYVLGALVIAWYLLRRYLFSFFNKIARRLGNVF